eukprot:9479990-Prorocentrum_lima.AAC.1
MCIRDSSRVVRRRRFLSASMAPLLMSSMCVEMRLGICGWKPQWEPVIGLAPLSSLCHICWSVTPC